MVSDPSCSPSPDPRAPSPSFVKRKKEAKSGAPQSLTAALTASLIASLKHPLSMPSALAWTELAASLVCLGTWPALLEKSRRPLPSRDTTEHRNYHFCFLDYAIAYAIFGLVLLVASRGLGSFALPLSSFGGFALVTIAAIGGTLLMVGNACMQKAIALGSPLTTLLPLQAAMCVAIGTSANYALQPERSHAGFLFLGVCLYMVAIASSTLAQISHQRGEGKEKAPEQEHVPLVNEEASETNAASGPSSALHPPIAESRGRHAKDSDRAGGAADRGKGLLIGALGGLALGFFSPCFNLSVNDEFEWCETPLRVEAANMIFALSFTISAVVSQSKKLRAKDPSWVKTYTKADDGARRGYAIGAGFLCSLGNYLQFVSRSLPLSLSLSRFFPNLFELTLTLRGGGLTGWWSQGRFRGC